MMRRREVAGKGSGSPSVKPGEGSSESFQVTMLRALMLPPRCRDVFVLKQIHGYTPAEVAAVLGMSTGDVRKHLRRALREMQPGLGCKSPRFLVSRGTCDLSRRCSLFAGASTPQPQERCESGNRP
jgi:DNA-binding CsgD family transcriptional regulator